MSFSYDAKGRMVSIPASWTSVVGEDPFVVVAGGRAYFRPQDLRQLADLIKVLKSSKEGGMKGELRRMCEDNYAAETKEATQAKFQDRRL